MQNPLQHGNSQAVDFQSWHGQPGFASGVREQFSVLFAKKELLVETPEDIGCLFLIAI